MICDDFNHCYMIPLGAPPDKHSMRHAYPLCSLRYPPLHCLRLVSPFSKTCVEISLEFIHKLMCRSLLGDAMVLVLLKTVKAVTA